MDARRADGDGKAQRQKLNLPFQIETPALSTKQFALPNIPAVVAADREPETGRKSF